MEKHDKNEGMISKLLRHIPEPVIIIFFLMLVAMITNSVSILNLVWGAREIATLPPMQPIVFQQPQSQGEQPKPKEYTSTAPNLDEWQSKYKVFIPAGTCNDKNQPLSKRGMLMHPNIAGNTKITTVGPDACYKGFTAVNVCAIKEGVLIYYDQKEYLNNCNVEH